MLSVLKPSMRSSLRHPVARHVHLDQAPSGRALHQSSCVVVATQNHTSFLANQSIIKNTDTEKQTSHKHFIKTFETCTKASVGQSDFINDITALLQEGTLTHTQTNTVLTYMQARLYLATATYTQTPGFSLYHMPHTPKNGIERSQALPQHFVLLEKALVTLQTNLTLPSHTLKGAFNSALLQSDAMRHYARVMNILYTTHNPAFISFMYYMAIGGNTQLSGWPHWQKFLAPLIRKEQTYEAHVQPYFTACTALAKENTKATHTQVFSHVVDKTSADEAVYVMEQFVLAENKLFSGLHNQL